MFLKNYIQLPLLFVLFTLFLPLNSWAEQFAWLDYRSTFKTRITVCHNKSPNIDVTIPSDFINTQGEYAVLVIEIKSNARKKGDPEGNFRWHNSWLKFNKKSYIIPTEHHPKIQTVEVNIKTKHLRVGKNTIKASFSWKNPNWTCSASCCGYYIRKMYFKDAPSLTYQLSVHSKPTGAKIYIGDKYFDTTPGLINIPRGYHVLKLNKDGYKPLEEKVYAYTDETLSFELEKIDATDTPPPQETTSAPVFDVQSSAFLSEIILPKAINVKNNKDAIAVVIGNQAYLHKDIPAVNYARNDASAMKKYLIDTLGYKDGNVIFEMDTSKAQLEMIFGTENNHRGMLYNYIKPEKSDVFIYYSGHGSPDPNTNKAYLVPTDCNPVMMDLTAYPLDVLYRNIPKIEAKRVTVVIDACFSGGTNTGKWLVPNASPALIKIDNPVTAQNNITIFTSAQKNQVSSWYPDKQHSMFTYFFLKAVTGDADLNKDKQITFQEIYNFVADRAEGVPYYAKRLHGGRIQTPTMQTADKDAVFVQY